MTKDAATGTGTRPGLLFWLGIVLTVGVAANHPYFLGNLGFESQLLSAALTDAAIVLLGIDVLRLRRSSVWALIALLLVAVLGFFVPKHTDAKLYYDLHRGEFAEVAKRIDAGEQPGGGYYGGDLPLLHRHMSATGKISAHGGAWFLPRWTGMPDDAGGYVYSQENPQGLDMYGMVCADPVPVGDGWWACGL